MIELALSFGSLIAAFCVLFFMYELFTQKYEERRQRDTNRDFDFTDFNNENFN